MNERRADVATVEVGSSARVRAQVVYEPGGWDGSRLHPRGYMLSVWPETLETTGGVTFAITVAGHGFCMHLELATRFSRRRLNALAEEMRGDARVVNCVRSCRAVLEIKA